MLWAHYACFRPLGAEGLGPLAFRYSRGCSCPELVTLPTPGWEGTERALVPQTSSRTMPVHSPAFLSGCLCWSAHSCWGWRQKPAPQDTFPPNTPSCPTVAFGFCSVYFKKIHWLVSVFSWLALCKHLSTTYILEHLFFFTDKVVENFLRGRVGGKVHLLEDIKGRPSSAW